MAARCGTGRSQALRPGHPGRPGGDHQNRDDPLRYPPGPRLEAGCTSGWPAAPGVKTTTENCRSSRALPDLAARAPRGLALPGHWVLFRHVPGVVDLAGPGGDGSFTVAAAGRLFILSRAGMLRPFARGPGGYSTALGPEPYITVAGNDRVAGTGCSFRSGMIFALQPRGRPGIILIGADGRARRFASLPGTVTPSGITFDATGHFGHKLLVTASSHAETTVLAIDCAGRVRAITGHAPAMEGGIAVAPASFGRYGGDLVAPGETSGRVFAIGPDGSVVTLVVSGLPRGGDIGVESAGFVPPGFSAGDAAYLADRFLQGQPAPGHRQHLALAGSGADQRRRPRR